MRRGSASTSTTGAISTTCRRTSAGSSASTQSNRSTTGSRRPSSRRSRDWRRRDALLARRERSARRRQAPSHRQTERKEPGGAGRLGIRRVHWRDGPMKPHRGAWQRGAACIQRRRLFCDDFVELQNCVWAKDVEWRVIECHAPIRRRASRQKNLLSDRGVAHCTSFLTRAVIERCRQGQKTVGPFQPSVAIFAILRLRIGPVTNDSATEHSQTTAVATLRLADASDAPGAIDP